MKLTPKDRKVLAAFLDGAARTSEKLSTDGRRLDGLWMGGAGIAFYTSGGDIAFSDLGSRAAQTIQRAIARAAPGSLDVSSRYVLTPRKRVGSSEARARKVLDVLPNGRRRNTAVEHETKHRHRGVSFVVFRATGSSGYSGWDAWAVGLGRLGSSDFGDGGDSGRKQALERAKVNIDSQAGMAEAQQSWVNDPRNWPMEKDTRGQWQIGTVKPKDYRLNGRRGARLRNHHLQVGDFVKYTPAGRSAFQGGKLFGRARRGTVRDSFGGPNDRYAVAWTDSGNVQDDVPGKYLEREERASGGAYFGPVLRNPAAKWTDGDTTSVLSHGHHGRILVTATARYVNRYLGGGEARKGWYALYLSDEPAGPEFWGSGTKAVCLDRAGPYTSRAAAKAAGSKRWKSWGTP